jgi:hypothetical protein
MKDKLTPQAEAWIIKNVVWLFQNKARQLLTDPELLKAQGLFTIDEVDKIKAEAWENGFDACDKTYNI